MAVSFIYGGNWCTQRIQTYKDKIIHQATYDYNIPELVVPVMISLIEGLLLTRKLLNQ
jgi:hypothetical protein